MWCKLDIRIILSFGDIYFQTLPVLWILIPNPGRNYAEKKQDGLVDKLIPKLLNMVHFPFGWSVCINPSQEGDDIVFYKQARYMLNYAWCYQKLAYGAVDNHVCIVQG